MLAKSGVLILSALLLTACGGGGGGGGSAPSLVKTTITGTVTPPAAPSIGLNGPDATVIAPPNNVVGNWYSISQGMDYTFDPAAAAAVPAMLKVTTLNIKAVDTGMNSIFTVITGAAYPTDPALGQTTDMANSIGAGTQAYSLSTAAGAVATQTTDLAGLPTIVLTDAVAGTVAGYVLPYSATLNPAGYTYQTFGSWITTNAVTKVFSEYYFSAGVPTLTALPALGTASYTGQAAGSFVNAATRDPSNTSATMNATVNFGARTVAFATTGTTTVSNNAALGTLPSADPGLNMSGTLSYAAGNNTFTGAVTTANGMSGNATGRFYGPGIAVATGNKAAGAPPEIGGTFAVMGTGIGAMQGAFAGK